MCCVLTNLKRHPNLMISILILSVLRVSLGINLCPSTSVTCLPLNPKTNCMGINALAAIFEDSNVQDIFDCRSLQGNN